MIVLEPTQGAVWHALNNYAYMDAVFLSERLFAEVNSDDALYLLATSYYRSGNPRKAYALLQKRGCPTAACKYLMARCCFDLNKLSEAESWLTCSSVTKLKNNNEDLLNEFGDSACFATALLGKIYSKTERITKAAEQFRKSLRLNPFLWSSFEELCKIGEKPDPSKLFQVSSLQSFNSCQLPLPNVMLNSAMHTPTITTDSSSVTENQDLPPANTQHFTPSNNTSLKHTPDQSDMTPGDNSCDPGAPKVRVTHPRSQIARSFLHGPAIFSPLTPSFGILPLDTPSPVEQGIGNIAFITPSPTVIDSQLPDPIAPSKKAMTRRGTTIKPPVFSQCGNSGKNTALTMPQQPGLGISSVANVRRSTRLFSNASSVKENNKGNRLSSNVPNKKNRTRSSKSCISQANFNELNGLNKPEKPEKPEQEKSTTVSASHTQVLHMQKVSAEGLMQLLQKIGKAYSSLSQFNCKQAVEEFNELPVHHLNTGWALSHLAKAYFEMAEYSQACKCFVEARRLEPYHIGGMEYYSTALWHLQKEVSLSALSQELCDYDKNSPQAWCAVGNCFSLQKEHDAAVKFFHRAIQVNPDFAYAYTLLGHEYVLTEELDKAMNCFRSAIRIDPRHYNAWYGVGKIYYKQEKFMLAELHFKKALSINPQSSVLMCHVGVVQHALQRSEQALVTLNKAIAADPKNPLCKFHMASVLFASDKHQQALSQLEDVKELVPKESLVYFLIGKVHKKLGNTHLALMNFSWAADLDPKGANNQIKEAIDKHYVNEDDEPINIISEASGADRSLINEEDEGDRSIVDPDELRLHAMESDESL